MTRYNLDLPHFLTSTSISAAGELVLPKYVYRPRIGEYLMSRIIHSHVETQISNNENKTHKCVQAQSLIYCGKWSYAVNSNATLSVS